MKPVWPEASQFGYFSYNRPSSRRFQHGTTMEQQLALRARRTWSSSLTIANPAVKPLRHALQGLGKDPPTSHQNQRIMVVLPGVDSPDVVLPGRKSIRRMTTALRAYQGCFLVKFELYCCHCWKRSSDLDNHIWDSERRVAVISPRLLSPLTNL